MRIGIIGVGLMGHGIAHNVITRGGFPLAFLDHPGNQPVADLLAAGATPCASAGEVAAAADVVILCVTGSPQVETVLTGDGGVLEQLAPGTVVVDCSTSLPDSTVRMGALVAAAGGALLDAPMTRLASHARAGTLNLLVGGDAATLERVRPVLACFTESIDHVGPLGHGHRLKLLHNFVSLGFMAVLGEAAAQAAAADVAPAVLIDVLARGGGAGAALERMTPHLLSGDAGNVPFAIANALKDIDYFRQMVAGSPASHAIADGVSAALSGVVRAGGGEAFMPALSRLLQQAGNA